MGPSDLEEQNHVVAEVVVHRRSSELVSKAEKVALTSEVRACEKLKGGQSDALNATLATTLRPS